jgi:hypothetical protein
MRVRLLVLSPHCQLGVLRPSGDCGFFGSCSSPTPALMVHFQHVFVVVEENQHYDEVIGNTNDLPYLNTLATKYGVATNYYANTHPSISNYFYLTAGRSGTKRLALKGGGHIPAPRKHSAVKPAGRSESSNYLVLPGELLT